MDARHFLGQRLAFIEQLYVNGATPFIERKRKIEAKENPFTPPYSEDLDSTFISEWLEAEESLQVMGRTCISLLSASFHLYLKSWERQLGRPDTIKYKSAFARGWLNGYKAYFLGEFNILFENSPCNLNFLEEIVLARNRVQHPELITDRGSYYSSDDLKKLSSPFFIDDRDRELLADMGDGELSWLMPPAIHVTHEKLKAAIAEIACFAEWLEQTNH